MREWDYIQCYFIYEQNSLEPKICVSLFCSGIEDAIPSILSVEIIKSPPLESAYTRQQEAFEMNNIPTNEVYVYHKCKVSTEDVEEIINNNLKVENTSGYTFGRGIYLSEYPELEIGYSDSGLLLCKVLPGKEYLDKSYRLIPKDYNSKRVPASAGTEEILIVENSSQILPCYFIHLNKTSLSTSYAASLPYNYKVEVPSDNRVRPLDDEHLVPRVSVVYAKTVPTHTTAQVQNTDEQEALCGSSTGNVPNPTPAPVTPVSQILNNGKCTLVNFRVCYILSICSPRPLGKDG